MTNDTEVIIDPINEEGVDNPIEEPQEPVVDEPTPVETDEAKAARLTRQANQARKKLNLPPLAEAKPVRQEAPVQREQGLNTDDLYALMESKVPKEDVKEVREYAQFKGISIEEALKSTAIKSILSDNAEKRKSADTANTGMTRRGAVKLTGEQLIDKASRGEKVDDMDSLMDARIAQAKARAK